MEKRISRILTDYRETIKPLLSDIKVRNGGNLPNNFLNEIRALNDHIARCHRPNIIQQDIDAELTKAEGHLRRLVYDCFKQLNIYISDTLVRKEKMFYSDLWLTHNDGDFWKEYSKNRKYAQIHVIEAKKTESIDADQAMTLYEKAFQNYRHAENLLIENKRMLQKSFLFRLLHKINHFWWWLLITVVLSALSAIIGIFW